MSYEDLAALLTDFPAEAGSYGHEHGEGRALDGLAWQDFAGEAAAPWQGRGDGMADLEAATATLDPTRATSDRETVAQAQTLADEDGEAESILALADSMVDEATAELTAVFGGARARPCETPARPQPQQLQQHEKESEEAAEKEQGDQQSVVGMTLPDLLRKKSSSSSSTKSSTKSNTKSNRRVVMNTPTAKGDRNAEACRRSRLKRKADTENLRKRNAELEADRDAYLERIAQLQMEVSSLRHDNCVDLDKENQLLRAEIRKHRSFIERVIHVVDDAPSMMLEERVRLLKTGIESGMGQIVGLLHTSTSWAPLETISLECGLLLRISYQLLPLGVPPDEVKRVNMRTEVHNVELDPAILAETSWDLAVDVDRMRAMEETRAQRNGIRTDVRRFSTPDLCEASNLLPDDLEIFEITEAALDDWNLNSPETSLGEAQQEHPKGQPGIAGPEHTGENEEGKNKDHVDDEKDSPLRAWVASTRAKRKLFPRAFACRTENDSEYVQRIRENLSPEAEDCFIIAFTELSKDLERAKMVPDPDETPEFRRPQTSVISGTVVVPTQNGNAGHIISVVTLPVGVFRSCEVIVAADGKLTENLREDIKLETEALWNDSVRRASNLRRDHLSEHTVNL